MTLEARGLNSGSGVASAVAPHVDEGQWYAPDIAAFFFGISSGYWRVYNWGNGESEIFLADEPLPNFVSIFWRDIPDNVAYIKDILKFPLFLGESGTGAIHWGKDWGKLTWKVVNRGF
jgi:hypothetical protein